MPQSGSALTTKMMTDTLVCVCLPLNVWNGLELCLELELCSEFDSVTY